MIRWNMTLGSSCASAGAAVGWIAPESRVNVRV